MTISKKTLLGYALSITVALLVAAPFVLGLANNVHAQALTTDQLFGGDEKSGVDWAASAGLGGNDLMTTITSVLRTALGFLGIIAVIMIMLGGFKWMTSGGEKTKADEAKKLIYAGIIGLVITLSAYAIATFVIDQITTVTTE